MSGSKSKKITYNPDDILSDDIDPDSKTKQNMQDIQDMQYMQDLDRNNYQYINNNQDDDNNQDNNNKNDDNNDDTKLEDDYKFVDDFLYSDSELRELLETGSISDILPVFKLNEESQIEDAYSGIDNTVILANANQKYNTAELLVQLGNQLIANLYQKENPTNPYLDFDTIINPNSSTLLKNGIVDRSDNTYIDRTTDGNKPVMKSIKQDIQNSYPRKNIQGDKNQLLRNTYIKSILLDSKYREPTYKYSSEYAIQLYETIKNVVSLKVKSVTIPDFLYNISSTLGNSLALFNPGKTNTTDSEVIIANNAYYEITSKTGVDNLSDSLFSYISNSSSITPVIPNLTTYTQSILLTDNVDIVKTTTTPMWFFLFDEQSKKIIINCLVPAETFPIPHTSPIINFPSIVWWSLLLENQYNGCNIFNISKYHNLGITLGFQDLKRNINIDREDEYLNISNINSLSNYFVTSETVDTEYKTVLNIQNTHSASGTKPIRIKRNDIHIVLPLKFQVPEGYILYSQVAPNQPINTQSKYLMALIDDYQYSRIPTQLVTTQTSKNIPDKPYQFAFQQNNVPKLSSTCSFPLPPYKSSYKENCIVENDNIKVYNYDTKTYEIFNIKNTVIKSRSNPRLNTQANIYKENIIIQDASNKDNSKLDQSYNKSNVLAYIPYPPKGSISNPINYITFTSQLSLITREYFGPVNIGKLKIQLLNDEGYRIDLANQDWSIVIEAEVLYQF